MPRNWVLVTLLLAPLVAGPETVLAQQLVSRFGPEPAVERTPNALRPLRVAKWSTLAVAAGAAAFGFSHHTTADRKFEQLERLCAEDGDRCANRLPNGAYADASLEALYQDVLDRDRKARIALVGSQMGLAASVIMFILDLRPGATPPNIPYEPRDHALVPRPDGGLELRIAWRPGTR